MPRWFLALAVVAALGGAVWTLSARDSSERSSRPLHQRPALRRPVAAAWIDEGRRLAVANSQSGTLSLVDAANGNVVSEHPIGGRLAGLLRIPGRAVLLTLETERNELLAISCDPDRMAVSARARLPGSPTALALSGDGRVVAVSIKWDRRVELFDVSALTASAGERPKPFRSVSLPFAPRELAWIPGAHRLIVGDAFGGRLALVDTDRGSVLATRSMEIHNIRGLDIEPRGRELYFSHQILDERSEINWQTVHNGSLMNNVVSRVPLGRLSEGAEDVEADRETIPVGVNGHGAGDPNDLIVDEDGGLTVLSGGTSELIVINRFGVLATRVEVGQRPIQALKLPANGGSPLAVTVNTYGDSLSLVDLAAGQRAKEIPLGPMRPLSAAERGEALFHNSHLSHQGWLSCQSCHTDGHSNGLRADTFGDGNWGAPKRVLPLGGVALTDRWAWNGQVEELYDQVRKSLLTTMLADIVDTDQANDLVAYLQTLIPPPPAQPPGDDPADRRQIARGKALFLDRLCNQCHVPPLTYSSSDSYDVGLEDENGRTKFNPPSLRGVGHLHQFFHDGRAKSLESVFRDFEHPGGTRITAEELADLVRFLRSL